MIKSVRANKAGFREVEFSKGLNLVLADRSVDAGDRDTTNALGKSTLIEVIDFCLGSNAPANKGLRSGQLEDWSFTLELELNSGHAVSVTRAVACSSFVIVEGDTTTFPVKPEINRDGAPVLDVKQWRSVLSQSLFGLATVDSDGGVAPTTRALLSYFVRNSAGAYISPFKYFENQNAGSIQVQNAFLLGLDWEKAAKWQKLKDQKSALRALRQAIKTGAVDGELSSLGELEAERVRLERQLAKEREALSSFQVLPQYRELEAEANRLTSDIHVLLNANIVDKRKLSRYTEVATAEDSPADSTLEQLYKEAGVALPGAVKKTLEEAREFNRTIVANRKYFIRKEMEGLNASIANRAASLEELTNKRATLLRALESHGALEELTALQALHIETKAKLESVVIRITQLRQMTSRTDEVRVREVELKQATETDHEERRAVWSSALALFAQFSEALYKSPGRLVINIGDSGYQFDVEISGSPSEGISKMKIFCYDLVLITLARQRGLGIDFLIHDSTIFDGVDPRQRAHALELAASMAKQHGFQYICTLNSDMLPMSDFSPGFDPEAYVRLRLTDTEPSGSLLGMRY